MNLKLYLILMLTTTMVSFQGLCQQIDTTVRTTVIPPTTPSPDSTNIQIVLLEKKVDDLARELRATTDNMRMLMASKDLDAQNRYSIVRQNLEGAVKAYRMLHTKIQGIQSFPSKATFDPLLKELNNPEGNKLGFRFNQKVVSLVEDNVKPKKRSIASRIYDGVSAITTNPVVSVIPVVSPAAQLTNTVMGFLRSTSVLTDDVDQATIAKLENELNGYIHFYNQLAEANTEFDYNLNIQRQELALLQRNLYDQVRYFAQKVGIEPEQVNDQEDVSPYLDRLFARLDANYITTMFRNFEQEHSSGNRTNYEQMLITDRGNDLKDANNRLEEFVGLINQFEFQYNKHYRYTNGYSVKLKNALDEAVTMGITQDNIRSDIRAEVESLKQKTDTDFRQTIQIDELSSAKKSIRYTARVI